jgi:hypothetical protein
VARDEVGQRAGPVVDSEAFSHLDASSLCWDRNIVADRTKTPFPTLSRVAWTMHQPWGQSRIVEQYCRLLDKSTLTLFDWQ